MERAAERTKGKIFQGGEMSARPQLGGKKRKGSASDLVTQKQAVISNNALEGHQM